MIEVRVGRVVVNVEDESDLMMYEEALKIARDKLNEQRDSELKRLNDELIAFSKKYGTVYAVDFGSITGEKAAIPFSEFEATFLTMDKDADIFDM